MRMLQSTRELVFAALIAGACLFQAGSASANCQVDQFSLEVAKLTNQVRAQYGLSKLHFNCSLYSAAKAHTADMVRMRRIGHTGSDGSSIGHRVKRSGYQYSRVGENVAYGTSTPQGVVRLWMNSAGHRQNILNPAFNEIGVGYWNGYWTQVLARR
jgi:uncharacterized protein YkwD